MDKYTITKCEMHNERYQIYGLKGCFISEDSAKNAYDNWYDRCITTRIPNEYQHMSNPEIDNYIAMQRVLDDVKVERDRQEELKTQGKFLATCADTHESKHHFNDSEKLAVLAEEFGEVSREVVEKRMHDMKCNNDGNPKGCTDPMHKRRLRAELIQVAAVCVAWVEGLDKE